METSTIQHTEIVKFNHTKMVCPIINGEPHVLVKSIIDGIGLSYNSAIENLKNNSRLKSYLSEWSVSSTNFDEPTLRKFGLTKFTNYTIIPVRKVAAWLYGIQANKVNEPARSVLIKFQDRCDDVLFQYFFGRKELEQAYFDEKRGLLQQKRELDTDIKQLRTAIQLTPEGKELNEKETELKAIKLRLQRLEQKQFGMIYSLFDQEPEKPDALLENN
jgi:hypothetical protein